MKMLSVRLKGSFSLSHQTTFSTNIKTHADTGMCAQIHTVYRSGWHKEAILSDVWTTANPLNNTENTISVPFLTAAEREWNDGEGRRWGEMESDPFSTRDAVMWIIYLHFLPIADAVVCCYSGGLELNESTSVQFLFVSLKV